MTESENSNVNLSKLRELAVRGKDYREDFEVTYYGEDTQLSLRPLVDVEFLPIAAFLEDKLGIEAEEAQEMVEEDMEENGGNVDPSNFDEEFVEIMQSAAIKGLTPCPKDDAEENGMTEAEWVEQKEEFEGIVTSLQGGKSLEIAERVLDISSDAESAEKFRRDGGSE